MDLRKVFRRVKENRDESGTKTDAVDAGDAANGGEKRGTGASGKTRPPRRHGLTFLKEDAPDER